MVSPLGVAILAC